MALLLAALLFMPGNIPTVRVEEAGSGNVTLNFPIGRYDIYPDKIVERELYVSNTTSWNGEREANKMKKIGILHLLILLLTLAVAICYVGDMTVLRRKAANMQDELDNKRRRY